MKSKRELKKEQNLKIWFSPTRELNFWGPKGVQNPSQIDEKAIQKQHQDKMAFVARKKH